MKRTSLILLLLLVIHASHAQTNKVFFANSLMTGNYFYSEATYSGPSWIANEKHKLPVCDTVFFTPGNSLQLHYVSAADGNWQAKIFYQPYRGDENSTKATRLVFRLYGASHIPASELPAIGIGNREKQMENFISFEKYISSTSGVWSLVSIPLSAFAKNRKPETEFNAIGFRQQGNDGKEHNLFIDQLELIGDEIRRITTTPELKSAKGYEKHVDITWSPVKDSAVKYVQIYRSSDGKKFIPRAIQSPRFSRYADFTDTTDQKYFYRITFLDDQYNESSPSPILSAVTVPMTDEQLLDMVQEANFRYYWEGAEPVSGLARENTPGSSNMIATGASGFGIMALIAGTERKFITRDQSIERFEKIASFLEKADKFHGAFPHFIDGVTGKTIAFFGPRDNGADLVETSFLMQGILVAKQYFNGNAEREKKLQSRLDHLWKNVEWNWFRKDNGAFLYWHWSPDQAWVINHHLIGWNETMITYVLSICSPSHPVPADLYYSGWASQSAEAQTYRKNWGNTSEGSMYTNGKTYFGIPLKVGVSSGGPLFFVHYSFMGLDPHKMQDAYTEYFTNNRNIALINYRYCVENPQRHAGFSDKSWGLTASLGLWDYSADEPTTHQDHGKITPTGALASFPYTPAESMAALKNFYRNYGKFLWAEYGFRDAFNLDENWCSGIFMGLNQAPITVMIENYRSGLIWNLFMKNPEIAAGVNKIKNTTPK